MDPGLVGLSWWTDSDTIMASRITSVWPVPKALLYKNVNPGQVGVSGWADHSNDIILDDEITLV